MRAVLPSCPLVTVHQGHGCTHRGQRGAAVVINTIANGHIGQKKLASVDFFNRKDHGLGKSELPQIDADTQEQTGENTLLAKK